MGGAADDSRDRFERGAKMRATSASECRRPPPMQRLGTPKPKRTVPCPHCTRRFFTWNGLLQHQAMTGH